MARNSSSFDLFMQLHMLSTVHVFLQLSLMISYQGLHCVQTLAGDRDIVYSAVFS